jgi:hypothetical protein
MSIYIVAGRKKRDILCCWNSHDLNVIECTCYLINATASKKAHHRFDTTDIDFVEHK